MDKRIGRWLSIDQKRQHFSPYLAMANNPIMFVDADGLTYWPSAGWAALNLVGGATQVVIAGLATVASEGAASPLTVPIIIDGSARTVLGFHNLMIALVAKDENDYNRHSVAVNLPGLVAQGVDIAVGNKNKELQNFAESGGDIITLATPNNAANIPK